MTDQLAENMNTGHGPLVGLKRRYSHSNGTSLAFVQLLEPHMTKMLGCTNGTIH